MDGISAYTVVVGHTEQHSGGKNPPECPMVAEIAIQPLCTSIRRQPAEQAIKKFSHGKAFFCMGKCTRVKKGLPKFS